MEILIYLANAILLYFIVQYEYNSASDKTIIISPFAFVMLLGLNLFFGLITKLDRKPVYRHFYYSALGLVVVLGGLLYFW